MAKKKTRSKKRNTQPLERAPAFEKEIASYKKLIELTEGPRKYSYMHCLSQLIAKRDGIKRAISRREKGSGSSRTEYFVFGPGLQGGSPK